MLLTATLAIAAASLVAYTLVCALVAWHFTTARRQAPVPFDGLAQQVSFGARDGRARIAGWYLPARSASLHAACGTPAVVFVHGRNACRGDELKRPTFALAQAFAAAGMAVLMIDLRGHGTSSRARLTYGARERFDVLGAVDWLRLRDHGRIGVLGASMGASAAILAAATEPAIHALVADSAYADMDQMFKRHYRKLSGLPDLFLPGALLLGRLLTGENLRRVSPLAQASLLRQRAVLVIHSVGDRFIPVQDGWQLASEMDAECWTTANGGHIGSYRAAPLVYTQRVLRFFGHHLQAAQPARAA